MAILDRRRSRRFSLVAFQKPTQPLATNDSSRPCRILVTTIDQAIAQPLMIPLVIHPAFHRFHMATTRTSPCRDSSRLRPGHASHARFQCALGKARARVLTAVVRLLLALLRASGFSLDENRLPKGRAKAGLLRAITSAEPFLPLATILRIIGLEPGRYHAWRRAEKAFDLTGRSSCPRSNPGQLGCRASAAGVTKSSPQNRTFRRDSRRAAVAYAEVWNV